MEHRLNQRRSIVLDVALSLHDLGLLCSRTRDISLGGMCVDLGQIRLANHQVVDVTFMLEEKGKQRLHCLPAMVTYVNHTRAGLKFIHQLSESTIQALKKILD